MAVHKTPLEGFFYLTLDVRTHLKFKNLFSAKRFDYKIKNNIRDVDLWIHFSFINGIK